MDFEVRDGSGKGFRAKVDENKRLHVDSVQRTQSQQAILNGDGYNLSTGLITLTSAGQSAVFYLKNTSQTPLIIKEVGVRLGMPMAGVGSTLIEIYKNGSAGTIIDNQDTLSTNTNRDFGSAKEIEGVAYKGAEGYTLTGGSSAGNTAVSGYEDPVLFDADIIILRQNNTYGVRVTPPAGTTSQTAVVFATVFYETSDTNGD